MLHFFRIAGAEHDGIGIGSRLELAIFPSIGILWICGAAPVAVGLALGPPVHVSPHKGGARRHCTDNRAVYTWVVLPTLVMEGKMRPMRGFPVTLDFIST